jgi:hypothetical protein
MDKQKIFVIKRLIFIFVLIFTYNASVLAIGEDQDHYLQRSKRTPIATDDLIIQSASDLIEEQLQPSQQHSILPSAIVGQKAVASDLIEEKPQLPQQHSVLPSAVVGQEAVASDLIEEKPQLPQQHSVLPSAVVGQEAVATVFPFEQPAQPPQQVQPLQSAQLPQSKKEIQQEAIIEEIQKILQKKKIKRKIRDLLVITLKSQGSYDSKTKNVFAQAIVSVSKVKKIKSKVTRALLFILLEESIKSSLLSPKQQNYVEKTLIPRVKKAIKKRRKNKRKQRRARSKRRKTNSDITIEIINKALKKTTFKRKIKKLTFLIKKAKGKEFAPAIKDAFGNALVNLFEQQANMSSADLHKFKKLLNKATTTSLLIPAQQRYVATEMLPKIAN